MKTEREIAVEVRAERAADCETGCQQAAEVLLGGLPGGIRPGELRWEALGWEKSTGMFLRKALCGVRQSSWHRAERKARPFWTLF